MPYKLWFKDSGKESSKDSGESSTALGIEEPERLYVCMHVFCLVQFQSSANAVSGLFPFLLGPALSRLQHGFS